MTGLVRQKKATPIAVVLFATRNKQDVRAFETEEGLKVYALADLALESRTYGERWPTAPVENCPPHIREKPLIYSGSRISRLGFHLTTLPLWGYLYGVSIKSPKRVT
jgi:hypothetical protein